MDGVRSAETIKLEMQVSFILAAHNVYSSIVVRIDEMRTLSVLAGYIDELAGWPPLTYTIMRLDRAIAAARLGLA